MLEKGIQRPVRDGLVGGATEDEETSDSLDGLSSWDGRTLAEKSSTEEKPEVNNIPKVKKVNRWWLTVDNKPAVTCEKLTLLGKRLSYLAVGGVLLLRIAELFEFDAAADPKVQIVIMLSVFIVLTVIGAGGLTLAFTRKVKRRGERFTKGAIFTNLGTILFANALVFALVFSRFEIPDFSKILL